jgi:Tol biopolymer transport system component
MRKQLLLSALMVLVVGCSAEADPDPTGVSTDPTAAAKAPYRIIKQGPYRGNLFTVGSDGSGHHEWDYPEGVDEGLHPDWSPDGTELAFVTDRADGSADILVSPTEGGTARILVDSPPGTVSDHPAWSPDGRYVAFNTDTQGLAGFRIVVADAGTGAAVTTYEAPKGIDVVAPRWRPDGQQLVVEAGRLGVREGEPVRLAAWVALLDPFADEPELVAVTPKDMWALYPDWSPDGSAISFTAGNPDPFPHEGSPSDLYVVDADGSNLTQLTKQNAWEEWVGTPEWNEDGFLVSLIFYDAVFLIARVSIDGKQITRLEDSAGNVIPGAHPRADIR